MHLRCMQTGPGSDSIWNQGVFSDQEILPLTTVIAGSFHDLGADRDLPLEICGFVMQRGSRPCVLRCAALPRTALM